MTESSSTYIFPDQFEQLYTRLRQKEGRIYADEEVANLPFINKDHRHYKEWKIRERSFRKLLKYIKSKGNYLNILEVGCGNGWLSAKLAAEIKGHVTGIDINSRELQQAKKVFSKLSNLSFINSDLRNGAVRDKKFDIIIFAASIQYFSSLKEILNAALEHLQAGGEIHILDSHFYRKKEVMAARHRTQDYYKSLGFAGLSNYYYHHSIEDLDLYRYKILNDPYSWKNKLFAGKNPFHWIVIKK